MKIYCFYLVKKHISTNKYKAILKTDIENVGGNECVLYAYTPDKSSRLYFITTRNMDLFYEKVIEMSREEYEDFYEEHTEQVFEQYTFISKKLVDDSFKSYTSLMLCTRAEADCILYYKEEQVMEYLTNLLDDDIISYLETHPFKSKLKYVLDEFFLYTDIMAKVHPMEDINYDNFTIDELSLYIKLFSNTFNKR